MKFNWDSKCEEAFDQLRTLLISDPVLAYPSFDKPFTLETDASINGLGAVLSQQQEDGLLHPIAYASRALSSAERNYGISEMETLAVVWAVAHFRSYLYGGKVTVFTDHSAVKAILEMSNPSGKHARCWTKVYGCGISNIQIVYRRGKENSNDDALSCAPQASVPITGTGEGEVQVAAVTSDSTQETLTSLLEQRPTEAKNLEQLADAQRQDSAIKEMIDFIQSGILPEDATRARKVATQAPLFTLQENILYLLDHKRGHRKRAAVPRQLRKELIEESHRGRMGGHFSGDRLYRTLSRHWWWEGMYQDVVTYCKNCPECAIVAGGGCQHRPPLYPIPVQRPFQIVGVDLMELPLTQQGNRYVIVFQDFFTKWPMVYPLPDQRSCHITRLISEEIVPMFGVSEALLSDRGANLLSNMVLDLCEFLGIRKLNTTSYHSQCDGMVERFNRTLKAMLRKHAARFGNQWDQYLSGVLWAYRNTPHETTGEKPSFLLFGLDCRSPIQASLLPTTPLSPTDVSDYREELLLSLRSARELAMQSIRKAQTRYKKQYDRHSTEPQYQIGDWVLVRFPQEETGRLRKLSRPWHGPFRITDINGPDVTVIRVYFPEDKPIQVHMLRVSPCPPDFPAGYYWYGKKKSSGRPAPWVEKLLSTEQQTSQEDQLEEGSDEEDPEEEPSTETESEESDSGGHQETTEPAERLPRRSTRYGLREKVRPPSRYDGTLKT